MEILMVKNNFSCIERIIREGYLDIFKKFMQQNQFFNFTSYALDCAAGDD